jgi:hypothetical protein
MRFHKSKRISAADAEALIDSPTSSLNGNSVISHNNDWYDVRLSVSSTISSATCFTRREQH